MEAAAATPGGERLEAFDIPSARAFAWIPSAMPASRRAASSTPARQGDRHSPSPDFGDALARARRALGEFASWLPTNLGELRSLLELPVARGVVGHHGSPGARAAPPDRPGAGHRRRPAPPGAAAAAAAGGPGAALPGLLAAPTRCRLVEISVAPGDQVRRGQQLAVVEAMKWRGAGGAMQRPRRSHPRNGRLCDGAGRGRLRISPSAEEAGPRRGSSGGCGGIAARRSRRGAELHRLTTDEPGRQRSRSAGR